MSKQLFNSTEKSNFILNMTEEKYSQLAGFGLSSACFTTAVFAFIPEAVERLSFSIVSGGLAISGVICLVLALIAVMKKYITHRQIFPACAFAVMLAWGVVSLADSYSVSTSFYGFSGRGEGILAVLFYFGFFVTGMSVKREKAVKSVINAVIASGILHSLISLVQIFTGKLSHYKSVSITTRINASSGLAQSPVFLAMFLTLSLTAVLVGAVISDSKKHRIFCVSCACLFSFVMMFTYSTVGIVGIILSLLSAFTACLIKKSPKKKLVSLVSAVIPPVVAVVIVTCGLIGNISEYKIYDAPITLWADGYMRISANGDYDVQNFDNSETASHMYSETFKIIKKFPLTGTGAEQLVYPQLYTYGGFDPDSVEITDIIPLNKGTFDKIYNEYLYVTATRGIPSLVALIAVIVSVLNIGVKKIRKKPEPSEICTFMMFACGVLIFFVGCGNITFSPVFWALGGLLICVNDKTE